MNTILKIMVLVLTPLILYGQSQYNKSITWEGKILEEYLPKLHANWNTNSLGGLLSIQLKNNDIFFTSFIGKVNFIPTSANDNFDYSLIRNLNIAFSYNPILNKQFDILISSSLGYTEGRIFKNIYKYLNASMQIAFEYKIGKKSKLFLNASNIFDIRNNLLTPSIKIGFDADLIIIAFDLFQYMNWGNKELRFNNFLSAPYINHHQ